MSFGEKLKELRQRKKISQEQLAEKLYVSRQAVTKWENGTGMPDVENLIAIAALFNESLDNLLSNEKSILTKHEFLYESKTEYDLDEEKRIDIKIGCAHEVVVQKTEKEKIQIMLASNKLSQIMQDVKVKIREGSRRMDVFVNRNKDFSDMQARDFLVVLIKIPERFVAHLEISAVTENLVVRDIQLDNLEFCGKLKNGFFTNASGHIELDVFCDINVEVDRFKGKIDFNQLYSASVLKIKSGSCYLRRIGTKNRFVDSNGTLIELRKSRKNDSEYLQKSKEFDFIAEIAGLASELKVINAE